MYVLSTKLYREVALLQNSGLDIEVSHEWWSLSEYTGRSETKDVIRWRSVVRRWLSAAVVQVLKPRMRQALLQS
jgi:hypothetical protein